MDSPDDIDRLETTVGAEEFALQLLNDAADTARALISNLPKANAEALSKHSLVAVGYALLVHLDHRADEQYQQGWALIEELRAIRESVKLIAPVPNSDDQGHKFHSAPEQARSDYAWLKELMELARPVFCDAQYEEAIVRLRRLAGA